MHRARQVLKSVFGYDDFRPGQAEAVEAILQGRDVLSVMPTGAGKSICYQVPALLMEGITLVVSPLISLMRDQVSALCLNGVRAAYLNSSLTPAQYRKALANARAGVYKIIYVAPERLLTDAFLDFAKNASIAMVTVDEAHCVSQWGQDFRPGYLSIAPFIRALPSRPVVAAFTATATEQVQKDVIRLLELQRPERIFTGFDRPNLYLEVRHAQDRTQALLDALGELRGTHGIVYCATRRGVEETCAALQQAGYAAVRYHAGLPDGERKSAQEAFVRDEADMIVATNAFGMGIDKSNVHYVIHMNMPKDMESYYQEAGRAGRDGTDARCILLYHKQDVPLNQFLIRHSTDDNDELTDVEKAKLEQRALERLRKMTVYASGRKCLRASILSYFGQEAPESCGNCSVCCGVETAVEESSALPGATSHVRRGKKDGLTEGDRALYERLAALRKRIAHTRSLPAFIIFSDATLREMAKKRPRTRAQMLRIAGVGDRKMDAYGERFLQEIYDFVKETGESEGW